MKKNFLLMLATALLISVAFTSCKDDDDSWSVGQNCDDTELVKWSWQLQDDDNGKTGDDELDGAFSQYIGRSLDFELDGLFTTGSKKGTFSCNSGDKKLDMAITYRNGNSNGESTEKVKCTGTYKIEKDLTDDTYYGRRTYNKLTYTYTYEYERYDYNYDVTSKDKGEGEDKDAPQQTYTAVFKCYPGE